MSASSKKKLRAEENAAKLTEKQLSERKEARKLRIYTIAFGVVLAVMIVTFLCVIVSQTITNSGVREKNTVALTVGEHKINNVEMNYFFIDAVNNFYSQYGSYAAMFGLDATTPLNQQVLDEETGRTWADDFLESAQSSARSAYAAADAAEAAGFTLPQEALDQLEQFGSNLDLYAKVYGFSDADAYVQAMYGNGASKKSYMDYYTRNVLASAYQTEYRANFTFSDDEIAARDAEDPTAYNSYSYHQYYLATSKFLTGGTTDENGSTTYSDAEQAAAEAAAEAAAKSLTGDEIGSVEDLDAAIAARQQVAIKYREALRDVEGITFFDDMPGVRHNYSYFPIFIDEKAFGMSRDALYTKMRAANVLSRRYFYPLISEFSTYRGLESANPANLPNAHKMADSVLCLPMHHALSEDDIQRTIELIKK